MPPATVPTRTPDSGLLADVRSGFLVFLIALPLCLGIALASGFPPIAGILTAVVGGMVATPLGSARLTIKGPAAGMIVIVIGAVTELGQGNLVDGYHRTLAVGVVAAAIQIVLALLRTATIGIAMSPSVVHGMLAAIGVVIISKQVHQVLGVKVGSSDPLVLIQQIPDSIADANPAAVTIGLSALLVLFLWPLLKAKWARAIPAPLVVLALAVPMGMAFDLTRQHAVQLFGSEFWVGPQLLVQLPARLGEALQFPDFSQILSGTSIKYIAMFAIVGTIESTLSCLAVDAMDPERRASNLNRDLLALGCSNLVSAALGGLPMISEIVRSRANIDAGARSSRSNFFHGFFLLAFVAAAPSLLQKIPLAALGAMLVFVGSRLASPSHFKQALRVGTDQFVLFLGTMVVTLLTDLLVGVASGLALKILLHCLRGASLRSIFRPTVTSERVGDELRIAIQGTASFPSILIVRSRLRTAGPALERIVVDLRQTSLVDHTFLSRLKGMADEVPGATLEIVGKDDLIAMSGHPESSLARKSLVGSRRDRGAPSGADARRDGRSSDSSP